MSAVPLPKESVSGSIKIIGFWPTLLVKIVIENFRAEFPLKNFMIVLLLKRRFAK